jgi:hypothetical protein
LASNEPEASTDQECTGKMRLIVLIGFITNFAFAQGEHYSLYFESELASGYERFKAIPESFHGEYNLNETSSNAMRIAAGDVLKIDGSGIYIEKNRILNISREEIRENSQYEVRDGWLHGVIEKDSLRVALDGELYYFLMPVKAYIFEAMDDQNTCFSTGRAGMFLILSQTDNEYYTSVIVEFLATGVELKELDYQCEKFDPKSIERADSEIDTAGHSTYYLDPTKEEWDDLFNCHMTYDSYTK